MFALYIIGHRNSHAHSIRSACPIFPVLATNIRSNHAFPALFVLLPVPELDANEEPGGEQPPTFHENHVRDSPSAFDQRFNTLGFLLNSDDADNLRSLPPCCAGVRRACRMVFLVVSRCGTCATHDIVGNMRRFCAKVVSSSTKMASHLTQQKWSPILVDVALAFAHSVCPLGTCSVDLSQRFYQGADSGLPLTACSWARTECATSTTRRFLEVGKSTLREKCSLKTVRAYALVGCRECFLVNRSHAAQTHFAIF